MQGLRSSLKMTDFFTALANTASAAALAENLRGRQPFFQRGVVTDNTPTEPDKIARRCLRVIIPTMGATNTFWLERINVAPADDPPLPEIGTTVLVGFYNGNPHDGFWIGAATNLKNPPFEQGDAVRDSSSTVRGNRERSVLGREFDLVAGDREFETQGNYDRVTEGQENRRTERDLDVSGGGSMTIANDAQCRVHHDATGFTCHTDKTGAGFGAMNGMIAIADRFGNVLGLGGATGLGSNGKPTGSPGNRAGGSFATDVTINLNGQALHFQNAGDVTINGQSIAVVGARDSRGDVLVDRGY
jgi:Type VI secretion system/phage-baseplate injector OB domain